MTDRATPYARMGGTSAPGSALEGGRMRARGEERVPDPSRGRLLLLARVVVGLAAGETPSLVAVNAPVSITMPGASAV